MDPILHGEVCLKLACLYEAMAEFSQGTKPVRSPSTEGSILVLYDRQQLLECLNVLEETVRCISYARRVSEHEDPLSYNTSVGVC